MSTKTERTRQRLLDCALELFERDGYEATTVGAIATAAGVSEMTFFRHFAAKEGLLLDDPFDPLIADAIAGQPATDPPLSRAVAGIRAAWQSLPSEHAAPVRARMRIAARTPSLRAAIWRNNSRTEEIIGARLIADGAERREARICAAVVLAAIMASLLDWAQHDEPVDGPDVAVRRALDLLDRAR